MRMLALACRQTEIIKRMNANIKTLGVRVDNFSREEIENWIEKVLDGPPEQKFVTTLNPEIVLKGRSNKHYADILNSADLALCDGFGIKFVSWLKGKKIRARYTGVDLVDYILKSASDKNLKALIVACENSLSSPREISQAIENKYEISPRVECFDGKNFFENESVKIAEIVLVNFGAPEQEQFIFDCRKKFPRAKILAGVGGAFDFLTGKMKRAPRWMRKTGLEWLYRVLQEPKRIRRIVNAVIVFPWVFLTTKNK